MTKIKLLIYRSHYIIIILRNIIIIMKEVLMFLSLKL